MNDYIVKYSNGKWVVDSLGTPRYDTFNKKKEALKQAKYYARKYGESRVTVYKKNGDYQRELNYS